MRLSRAFAGLEAVDAVEPDAERIGAVGIEIGQRRHMPAAVPFLAIDGAGMTAHADVEIDDEAELLGARRRQAGHRAVSRRPRKRGAVAQDAGRRRHARRTRQRHELRRGLRRLIVARLDQADLQIVPGGLAGHRIAVGIAIAAGLGGQQFRDHMVQQEAALGLRLPRATGSRRRPACRWRSRSRPYAC